MQLISERKRIISTNHAQCYYHNRNYYRPILLVITWLLITLEIPPWRLEIYQRWKYASVLKIYSPGTWRRMEVRRDSRPEFQSNSERKPWEEPKYRETSRKLRSLQLRIYRYPSMFYPIARTIKNCKWKIDEIRQTCKNISTTYVQIKV